MQLLNKILLVLGMAAVQSVNASLAQATAPQAPEGNLAQVTGQAQSQDRPAVQILPTDKPSQVFLGVVQIGDVPCKMATAFTQEEVAKYPDYKESFARHAAYQLESSNTQDVATIVYLVNSYPEIAGFLAVQAVNRKERIHVAIKYALENSDRPPLMTTDKALDIAKQAPLSIAGMHLFWGFTGALNNVNANLQSYLEQENTLAALQAEVAVLKQGSEVVSKQEFMQQIIESGSERRWEDLKAIPGGVKNDMVYSAKKVPGAVLAGLPRSITVGVGTAALTTLMLREFDERVGDLLPEPQYDPKSNNIQLRSYRAAKWVVRNVALPFALSWALGKTYDTAASAINAN